MRQLKAAALVAALVLLAGCDDENDSRIETYKKYQDAGMVTREGVNHYGSLTLYCTIPEQRQ